MGHRILWLEDNRDSIDEAEAAVKKSGYRVTLVSTIMEAGIELDASIAPEGEPFCALIIDIMLMMSSKEHLQGLGVCGVDTRAGLVAGIVFLDRFLRSEISPFRELPVLILSNRPESGEMLEFLKLVGGRGGGSIEYVEKGFGVWIDKIHEWLKIVISSPETKNAV